jgi:hypothetical protein
MMEVAQRAPFGIGYTLMCSQATGKLPTLGMTIVWLQFLLRISSVLTAST